MNGEQLQVSCHRTTGNGYHNRPSPRVSGIALALSVILTGIGGVTVSQPVMAQATSIASQKQFSVPAGNLREALDTLASQSGITVMYSPDLVGGKTTRGLAGRYTSEEALRRLLQGSGLEAQAAGDSTFTLRRQVPVPAPVQPSRTAPASASAAGTETQELEKITVTGTRIRGAQPSSPLVIISQEEMRLAGHNNLGEVIRALPQNFSGGQNPGVTAGADGSGVANQNITGSSSLNLRGLGADATLTLLNGTRLPFDGFSQATDVSAIPVAATERVEVLLDGASAIYGSDAVGGVANVVLKRDYSGMELAARYGVATDGGYGQTQYTVVAGTTWSSGGILLTGDFSDQERVRSGQRDFLSHLIDPNVTIYPASRQKGVLANLHQRIGDVVELELMAFYTKRRMEELYDYSSMGFATSIRRDASIWGIAPAIKFVLPNDWSLRVHGAFGDNEAEVYQQGLDTSGTETFSTFDCYCNSAKSGGVEAEGPLFETVAGEARVSVGVGYRSNDLVTKDLITGTTGTSGKSRSNFGYGEINLPLVNPDRNIPGLHRLTLNGAFRYEDYESFGDVTTPKIGAIWGVTNSLDVKATWGKSFKAPTLAQLNQSSGTSLYPASSLGATGAPAGATALILSGGNPDLGPERAKTLTAGLVLRPQSLPGLTLEANWFDIDYTDRVLAPLNPRTQALVNPAFADLITWNPTTSQQETAIAITDRFFNQTGAPYDPTSVIAIANNLYTNVAGQKSRGLDLSVQYAVEAFSGDLTLHGTVSHIASTRQITTRAPELEAAGVIYFPAKNRGRVGASWSRGSFALSSFVNYIGQVRDTNSSPSVSGSSMATLDLNVDYWPSRFRESFGVNLSLINVFNESPPFLQPFYPFYVNYDSTNYSPLGRVVNMTLTKRF